MSLHSPSPLSPSFERPEPPLDDMVPPQRVIERMSSYPSLSHSSNTEPSDDLHDFLAAGEVMTPIDASMMSNVKLADDEQEVLSPTQDGRRGFRGLTKSMQSLRGRSKSDKERSRSTSRERPPVPTVQPGLKVSAANRPTQPIAIPSKTDQPVRPKPQRSGSSFSSFIRKLTGKSQKPVSPASAPPASSLPPPSSQAPRRSPPSRKPTLAINTGNDTTSVRAVHSRKTSLPLDLVVPVTNEKPLEPAPLTAPPRVPTITLVDPRMVPLPPSPPSPAVVVNNEEDLDFSLSPTSYDRLSVQYSRSGDATKMIRDDEDDDDSEENDDTVNDLPSPAAHANGRISTSPVSTLNDPDVRTPMSPGFPQNQEAQMRSPSAASGNSPPRTGLSFSSATTGRQDSGPRREPAANLGRKESKWRKSVMNLSDTLNGQSKRVSKPAPTSFDAYQHQQHRMANNRRSCAPTLHSTATVSAEIRQIKDKEQQDMADTFFLS